MLLTSLFSFWEGTICRKVSTFNNSRQQSFPSEAMLEIGILCKALKKKADNIFLHCEFLPSLGVIIFSSCGVLWCSPTTLAIKH